MSKSELEAGDRETAASIQDETGRGKNFLRRMYDWTIQWSEKPNAQWALFVLAFAEASFFPIPPDVLLIAMAMGLPRRSLRFAAICTAGSVLGGCLGYLIGATSYEVVGAPIIEFYSLADKFNLLVEKFGEHGFLYIFISGLTPIPYKVFTIAAGFCHREVGLGVLIAASIVGRGLRFFSVALLFRVFGPPIKKFIDKYFNLITIAFIVLLVGGFFAIKYFARR